MSSGPFEAQKGQPTPDIVTPLTAPKPAGQLLLETARETTAWALRHLDFEKHFGMATYAASLPTESGISTKATISVNCGLVEPLALSEHDTGFTRAEIQIERLTHLPRRGIPFPGKAPNVDQYALHLDFHKRNDYIEPKRNVTFTHNGVTIIDVAIGPKLRNVSPESARPEANFDLDKHIATLQEAGTITPEDARVLQEMIGQIPTLLEAVLAVETGTPDSE